MEPGERHITPEEAPWPNAEPDPEETIGAGFKLAPRETADDFSNNHKSLNRALKGRLFLLCKQKSSDAPSPWFFPFGIKQENEKMRETAIRELMEWAGVKSKDQDEQLTVNPVGFAPMGYLKWEHDETTKQKDGYDGTKVFFYKSQLRYGDVSLNATKAEEYVWVTQDELKEYMKADVAEYVTKMVPP